MQLGMNSAAVAGDPLLVKRLPRRWQVMSQDVVVQSA